VAYRAETVKGAGRDAEERVARIEAQLADLRRAAETDVPDPGVQTRIAELEAELARLDRDREAELARQLAELEQQLTAARAATSEQEGVVERMASAREQARERFEGLRGELREAERAVEATRREAARVGGELAACNQFLRSQTAAPGGAAVLADQLEVDPGYEVAVAAALDGRLRAAVLSDRAAADAVLDRAGADGGRALVVDTDDDQDVGSAPPPLDGAERLADRVHGPAQTVAVARRLLRDTWVMESFDALPERFAGVAVSRAGRVWAAATRELRQAPAVGEERVLAERNRREELIRASEAAVQEEVRARAALERLTEEIAQADAGSARAVDAHRAAVNQRDEAAERERRLQATIERRRNAPDDGPEAGRRMQLAAEVAAARAERDRAERERTERRRRIERLAAAAERDRVLLPVIGRIVSALEDVARAIGERRAEFETALRSDREAGEHVAAELKECAQREATLHAQLRHAGERLTEAEVRLQRVHDRVRECEHELGQLAARLDLEAAPADAELSEEEREALRSRLERLARRREQLGPVNPLAQAEYEEALAHVEELERQRDDLETALRELNKLIADTDRQIRESFEQMFEAAARNFEQVAARLFPGGRGRLRLVREHEGPARVLGGASVPSEGDGEEESGDGEAAAAGSEELDEDLLGVEIEITPAGKEMKRLTLLSGGEKSMTALAFLFAVFLARPCPFYILDEVEAALDDLNIDRFLELLRTYSGEAQFIVVTHQKRTMEAADSLYGVSMGSDGISKVISRRLPAQSEQAA
jgi:chromosome segregation protein